MTESPGQHTSAYVDVALPVPLRQSFTYKVDDTLHGMLNPGSRVAVPFNRRKLCGYVVGFRDEPPPNVSRVFKVAGMLDEQPIFTDELLSFLQEAARYYYHPLGEVLRSAAPALSTFALKQLRKGGFLKAGEQLPGRRVSRPQTWLIERTPMQADGIRLGPTQKKVLDSIESSGSITLQRLRKTTGNPRSVVRALRDKGLVSFREVDVIGDPFFADDVARDIPPTLTAPQDLAVREISQALQENSGASFLLHGVTGSGKTEVYLHSIEEARKLEKGVIVLVPEIALTPQLVHRFRARFGDEIAVLHSGLKESQRDEAWRALRSADVSIAIGARSALFAPVKNLGLIVVDEEHDASFKQEEGFRYHARDMALLRAKLAKAVCVMGSATPSVESFYAATTGKNRLLSLPLRATGQQMPSVEIVDLRHQNDGPAGTRLLSAQLLREMETCLAEDGQAILFLNRRGFAPSLRCADCGELARCSACSVTLTEHRASGVLRCHYCDFATPVGMACTSCGHPDLERLGLGTEQLEDTLASMFPSKRVARLDRDTARGIGHDAVLSQFRKGDVDVLVGTQMVTKGHDIASVTLVGVVLADQSLAFPDFRATERTFQLLAQVAGRSGRGDRVGKVTFQTYQPEHFAVQLAARHDYESFYERELEARRELGYPPFGRVVALRIDAGSNEEAQRCAQTLADHANRSVRVHDLPVRVLGPAPAPIERLRGRYRYRLMLRSSDLSALRGVAKQLADKIDEGVAPARATIDVDPVSML